MAEFTFVEKKPMGGVEHAFDADATIGREGCDIVLPDPEVSRRHAALRITDSGPAIEDFGSTNGTFVNDERVEGVRHLNDGDVVRLGNTEWQLRANAEAAGVGAPQVTTARAVPAQAAPPAPPAAQAAPAAPAAPAATAAQPAAPPVGAGERRGDVPAPPEVTPSAIHRTLPQEARSAPPAFAAVGTKQTRGSAATRAGYTAFCMAVFLLALAGVIVYFIVN